MDYIDPVILVVLMVFAFGYWRIQQMLEKLQSKMDVMQTQLSLLLQSETIDSATIKLPRALKAKLLPYIRSGRDTEARRLIEETLYVGGDISSRLLLQLKSPDVFMELDAKKA